MRLGGNVRRRYWLGNAHTIIRKFSRFLACHLYGAGMGPVSAPSFRVRVIFEAEKAISEFSLILKNLTNDELSDLFDQNNSYAVMSNDMGPVN